MKRDWLKEFREKRNMTHDAVAENAGISRSYYTEIENGLKQPSTTSAKKIAKVLKFKWTKFFDDDCRILEQST